MATQSAVLPAGVWTDVASALSLTAGSTYTLEAYGQTVELIEDNTAPGRLDNPPPTIPRHLV